MRIVAGARGAGKTYETIHAAASDPDGFFVCRDYRMVQIHLSEYKDIIQRDKMLTYKQIPDETKAPLNLYVDGLRTHEEIPSLWYLHHNLVLISVEPKMAEENPYLSQGYIDGLRRYYDRVRDTNL